MASDPVAEAILPFARTAYAQGWASTGGPMTDSVKAGCIAAIENAVTHADHPRVLEVTFHLGRLEGIWAALFARREALQAKHAPVVNAAWRQAARVLDLSLAIQQYRSSLGSDTTDHGMIADAIAASIVHAVTAPTDTVEPVIKAIAAALKDAEAEGWAAGTAITADQRGVIAIDFDLPFQDAWNALGDLGRYWADAKGWLGEISKGVAGDLGRTLAKLGTQDASYDDMLSAAGDILTGDERAVSTALDMAMSQSFSRGTLALYQREGVRTVDFLTAGTKVCPRCEDIEAKNPWPIGEVPQPAIHPHCRCQLAPSSSSLWDPITALGGTSA